MNNKPYILSKSTYIRGLQCHKALYLHKNYAHLRTPPDDVQKAKFQYGKDFETTFKNQFPQAIDIYETMQYDFAAYPAVTQSVLQQHESVTIFEAGLQYDQVLVLTDVLIKEPNESIHIYEVKNMDRISPVVWQDASLQYFVAKHALPQLKTFNIVVRGNTRPFRIVDVTKELEKKSVEIAGKVQRLKDVLLSTTVPDIPMGLHCTHPYKCDFIDFCTTQQAVEEGKLF